MKPIRRFVYALVSGFAGATAISTTAIADAVTEWNTRSNEIIAAADLATPPANRIMAIAHTAAYAAANAISRRYPPTDPALEASASASIDAAIAAAHRTVLAELVPSQRAAIDEAYREALRTLHDASSVQAGIAVGEKAAAAVLQARADDGATAQESYRPNAAAGSYVPTAIPVASQWPRRKPWLMDDAAQFRPGPPPPLHGERWGRDYDESKRLGGKGSSERTAEQTAVARFWEATLPAIYHGLVQSLARTPGRDATQNARLFAAVTQAADDALIAVFDAKYHYGFWRPVTAIRNGDIDGNDATERDPAWLPFIDTPLHPEYPCAHCIVAAAVGVVLQAEAGEGPEPIWTTTSSTANTSRSWPNIEAFVREVADARVYDGVHYRYSTEVGAAMGRQVGALAVARYLRD